MDTTKPVTHISLCAGYGGIDLGLKRAIPNLRTVAFSEIEAFACANLVAKMEAGCLDPAPIWTDLKTFPWAEFRGKVDILSGGYPCQPFSSAGKRLGKEDPRHLWPWIADGIRVLQPTLCFFENVEGHISLGLRDVIGELEESGYRATWGVFSAAEVGTPHQRKRVFILAHRVCERGQLPHWWRFPAKQMPIRDGETWRDGLAFSVEPGSQGGTSESLHTGGIQCQIGRGSHFAWPSRPGHPQFGWEPPRVVGNASQYDGGHLSERHRAFGSKQSSGRQTQPALGRDADGPAGGLDYAQLCVSGDNRTDELRLLGNGVVPATAALAFRTLLTQLDYDLQRMHPAAPDRTQFDPVGRGGPSFRVPADYPALGGRPAAGTAHPDPRGGAGQA